MRDFIILFKRHYFKLMVIISICIIFYYTIGSKVLNRSSSVNSQKDSYISAVTDQTQNGDWNEEMVFAQGADSKIPIINTVRLADQKKEEQTIVMEDNSKLTGTDVILAEKNKKANWIFRFSDGKACNGRISIEGFGTIIPVIEKQMVISFAPSKDFTIICDQGKFNYYIKVVDNLNTTLNTTKAPATNQSSAIPNNKSASKPIPEKSGLTKQTTTESASPTSTINEATSTPQEEPKKGILDHIFHHN